MYLICYLYTIVLTKITRNKDIYKVTSAAISAINVQQQIKSLEDRRQTFDDGMLWTKLSQGHANPN